MTLKPKFQAVKHRTSTATAEGSPFTTDVQDYTARQSERQESIQKFVREYERSRPDPKREFEQISTACRQLEQSITGLQDTKRGPDQVITSARNASVQVQEINEPRQSYSRGGMRY